MNDSRPARAYGDEAGSTRERIKAAARDLFVERGLHGVSFGDIAGVVGTTRANLHYHFGGKQALTEAVLEDYARGVLEEMRGIWGSPGLALEERFERMIESQHRRFREFNADPDGTRPWGLNARARFETDALSARMEEVLRQESREIESLVAGAVRMAVDSGELRPDTDVEAAVLIVTPVLFFADPISQYAGGFRRLAAHYRAACRAIHAAWGAAPAHAAG